MPPIISGLLAPLLQGDELVAKIYERGILALPTQAEFKQAPVEGQSLFDVAHLERDVVQSDSTGFTGVGHGDGLQMCLL
jgi:hypothetical protein